MKTFEVFDIDNNNVIAISPIEELRELLLDYSDEDANTSEAIDDKRVLSVIETLNVGESHVENEQNYRFTRLT